MPPEHPAWQRIATAALLGTERAAGTAPSVGIGVSSLQTLLDARPSETAESNLLTTAGALTIYLRAGRQLPITDRSEVVVSSQEELTFCGTRLEGYLQRMLAGEQRQVLPECLRELTIARRLAPPHLLPELLELTQQQRDYRPLLAGVIGNRGEWLAERNPDWRFMLGESLDPSSWDTGSFDERVALLRHVRQTDAAAGRTMVERTWKDDAPEHRAAFLELLLIGLSADDEPVLEAALDDRRKEVRRAAADLLARLPSSALVARMLERSAPLIQYQAGSKGGLKGLLKGKKSSLEVTLPEQCDKVMQRDGIEPKPGRSGLGERAWWLMQVLGATPPRTWSDRFQASPEELVELAAGSEWKKAILNGWATAAVRHRDWDWATALLEGWIGKLEPETTSEQEVSPALLAELAQTSPQDRTEALIVAHLNTASAQSPDHALLSAAQFLSVRWGLPLSQAVVGAIESHLSSRADVSYSLLQMAAERFSLHISPEILPQASRLLDNQPPDRPPVYVNAIRRFVETVRFRHDMLKEITS